MIVHIPIFDTVSLCVDMYVHGYCDTYTVCVKFKQTRATHEAETFAIYLRVGWDSRLIVK